MPFCPECGNKINTTDKFCGKCGKNLKEQTVNTKPQSTNIPTPQKQVKYEGSVHKCPFCGEVVESLKKNCPSCGKEFRDTPSSMSVKEFSQQLIALNNSTSIIQTPTKKKIPHKQLLLMQEEAKEQLRKKRIALIQSFPIPNSKEDIIEFLVLANSNITPDAFGTSGSGYQQEIANAWISKYEQAIQKAKILLGDCTELKIIEENYKSKHKEVKKSKTQSVLMVVSIVLAIVLCYVGMFAYTDNVEEKRNQRFEYENQRLELILDDINEAIDDEDYDKAKLLTARLVFNTPNYNQSAEEKWDGIREDMYKRISELESKADKKK